MKFNIARQTMAFLLAIVILSFQSPSPYWESKFIRVNKDGSLKYIPDEKGNIIPDFSRVGYYGADKDIPRVAVVKTIEPAANGTSEAIIQAAIDEVSKKMPGKDGFRGAILLKKGIYKIPEEIHVGASGIVLRGEGDNINGTRLIALSKKQVSLIHVSGKGNITEIKRTRVKVTDEYVPVGSFSFNVASASSFTKGDRIIVFRPGTEQWIKDLQMDKIEERDGTKQWQAGEYDFRFERVITKIEGNKIFIDNPVAMAMETKYGGAEIYKFGFDGRISHVGIENPYGESEFESDTADNQA